MAFRNWKQELEDTRPPREVPWPFIIKTTACVVAVAVTACVALWGWPGYLLAKPWQRPGPVPDSVCIVFSSDLDGYLEPCGCTEQRWGGLARSSGYLGSIKEPEVRLVFDVGGAVAGRRKWQGLAWQTFLDAAEKMGYMAVNLGRGELVVSPADITRIAAASPVPIISANTLNAETGQLLLKPYIETVVSNLRVTAVGVVSAGGPKDAGIKVADIDESLGALLPELRRKTDVLVLLAACDEGQMRDIAQRHPEIDVILGGCVSQASREIELVGTCRIFYHANNGQLLGRLDLAIRLDGRPAGATSAMILLDNDIPEDLDVVARVERFNGELANLARQGGLEALGVTMTNRPAGENAYVGAETCLECHPKSHATWQSKRHSRAFSSLVRVRRQSNPDCIRCHVVALGAGDGYRGRSVSPGRMNVQCESCHDRALAHVRARHQKQAQDVGKLRPVKPRSCEVCHDSTHSPQFNYTSYWKRIVHGKEEGGAKAVDPEH